MGAFWGNPPMVRPLDGIAGCTSFAAGSSSSRRGGRSKVTTSAFLHNSPPFPFFSDRFFFVLVFNTIFVAGKMGLLKKPPRAHGLNAFKKRLAAPQPKGGWGNPSPPPRFIGAKPMHWGRLWCPVVHRWGVADLQDETKYHTIHWVS